MIEISLLREKFIIKEKTTGLDEDSLAIDARSNRMIIKFYNGERSEDLIVRANTMHTCARFVGFIAKNFEQHGPLTPRLKSIDWDEMWNLSLNAYERAYNPDRWVSIYSKGHIVFKFGTHHPLLDVIEQCDAINKGDYGSSLDLAKKSFKDAGKDIRMSHNSNVALVAVMAKASSRYSMILRTPDQTTTFNFTLKPLDPERSLNIAQGLSGAADFLEGVQLAFLVGMNNEKLNQDIIDKFSDEAKQGYEARERIKELDARISGMENLNKVRYRPERPRFELIIGRAQSYAVDTVGQEDEIYIE